MSIIYLIPENAIWKL